MKNAKDAIPAGTPPAPHAAPRLCGEAFPPSRENRPTPPPSMTAALPFDARLAAALRAPAPGDPPFPLDRLASRLAESAARHSSLVTRHSSPRRRVAAAALVLLALGAGAAAVFYRPDPLLRDIPSIAARDATFPEFLGAVRDELARLDPDPESAVSLRIELPDGRRVEDLPHVTIAAHHVSALAILDTAADMVGLESRREGNTVVFVPKPDDPPAPPEGAVVHYGNEWDRDPATRPSVLETREWTLPDPPPGPAAARPRTSREWKKWFSERGVDWSYGSSLAYNEALGLLRIENAPEQLELAEAILAPFLHAESAEGAEFESHAETAETAEPESLAGSAESESHAESAETAEP